VSVCNDYYQTTSANRRSQCSTPVPYSTLFRTATVLETVTSPGGQEWALTIHGASDVSPEDAQRDARDRLQRVVAAGGPARTSGSGLEYYPLRRLPEELPEEVHTPERALVAAITRNRYG